MKKLLFLTASAAVLMLTQCCKEKCDEVDSLTAVININEYRGVYDGIGSSLTESSAYVLACLPQDVRNQIIEDCFGESGANFSMSRTQIGASDFSVEGRYSLAPVAGDTLLESFSLDEDKKGFPKSEYPYIIDENYDLYNLMSDVNNLKKSQADSVFKMVACTWTPPAWMKDINDYYSREMRTGGKLLPQYYQTYANYILKFIQAYNAEGLRIWAISPANEPQGNDGNWESVHISPEEEAVLIGKYIGPILENAGYSDVKILGFDQNVFEVTPYAASIYGDSLAYKYTSGMALHWYGSTVTAFPDVLDTLHASYPEKAILHTEGCIDNLGRPAWDGVQDPEGFQECCWFKNDAFWWHPYATDWAYSTEFWRDWHPKYASVHRYARFIIEGMNHYLTSFIDWNVVLDKDGGPNHVGNFAGAPIMVDLETKEVYYTPVYSVLRLLSRNLRPGDKIVYVSQIEQYKDNIFIGAVEKPDGSYTVCVLNTLPEEKEIKVKVGERLYNFTLKGNSVEVLKHLRK
ncbi:MAG: hypothetical protein MJ003_05210 [Paludibacteraceae bacterium]|nr:hypothetical protein [Paludibacteraceae bacterium]